MLGLDDYGSDAESDTSDVPRTLLPVSKPTPLPKPKSSLSALLPPAKKASSISLPPPASSNGLNLPAPKGAKSKRREGPIKITVEALKPVEGDEDEPQAKRRRLDKTDEQKTGAGSSILLSMLPAPKNVALEAAPSPPKALGSGGSNAGGVAEASVEDDNPNLSFLPAHLRKPRTQAAPSISKMGKLGSTAALPVIPAAAPPEADSADFFSLGLKLPSSATISKPITPAIRSSVSAAPQVKEYEPPPPTPFDPYPGYYEMPSGEWAMYDPAFYKQHWASWQAGGSSGTENSTGRDGKGWEGADSDDMLTVDAAAELKKEQLAELERRKGLTAPPTLVQAPPPTIKQKAGTVARSRHQLSTLLADAYSNRAIIEEKLAEGRRNRKEAGNKYGF